MGELHIFSSNSKSLTFKVSMSFFISFSFINGVSYCFCSNSTFNKIPYHVII